MATTGELRAIIQDLHLVDIGDAASYLGEEAASTEEAPSDAEQTQAPELVTQPAHPVPCDCTCCKELSA